MSAPIPEDRLGRCLVRGCASMRIHWHPAGGGVEEHPLTPRCVRPRLSVKPTETSGLVERHATRTLRIEVTDADALAARDFWLNPKPALVLERLRTLLEWYAARLRARQWVDVPAEATIPVGMLHRDECVRQDGTMWAHEDVARVQISPEVRQDRVVCVPADRLDDLVYPEPPKDLAARLADRLPEWTGDTDEIADALRAALAAEGVEG